MDMNTLKDKQALSVWTADGQKNQTRMLTIHFLKGQKNPPKPKQNLQTPPKQKVPSSALHIHADAESTVH